MTLILRCQSCKSADLEILRGSAEHHSELRCKQCDRVVRTLSAYQAKAFSRHIPTRQIESVQTELGGEA